MSRSGARQCVGTGNLDLDVELEIIGLTYGVTFEYLVSLARRGCNLKEIAYFAEKRSIAEGKRGFHFGGVYYNSIDEFCSVHRIKKSTMLKHLNNYTFEESVRLSMTAHV